MTKIVLRPVAAEHADLLLAWVNRPDSLAGKIETQGSISRDAHVAWLARRLADPLTRMCLVCVDGEPVGQVRLQAGDDGVAVVDIFVLPEARRGGVARAAITGALADWARLHGWVKARAVVKRDNERSAALFRALGFRLAADEGDRLVFEIEKTDKDFAA
jgi:RimJ/RimL family protein N-acetyltransferase